MKQANAKGGLCQDCVKAAIEAGAAAIANGPGKEVGGMLRQEPCVEPLLPVEAMTGPLGWQAMQHVVLNDKDQTPLQKAMRKWMQQRPEAFAAKYAEFEAKYQPEQARSVGAAEVLPEEPVEVLIQKLIDDGLAAVARSKEG